MLRTSLLLCWRSEILFFILICRCSNLHHSVSVLRICSEAQKMYQSWGINEKGKKSFFHSYDSKIAKEDFSFWRTFPENFLREASRKSREKYQPRKLGVFFFSDDWTFPMKIPALWFGTHALLDYSLQARGIFCFVFVLSNVFHLILAVGIKPESTRFWSRRILPKFIFWVCLLGLKMKNRTIRSYNFVISVSTNTSFLENIVKLNDSAPSQWVALGTFNRSYMQHRL